MYFPFLRGKKYELNAISELSNAIVKSKKVIPIIEPVNLNSTTLRIIIELNEENVPLVFIINPQDGDLKNEPADVFQSLINDISNHESFVLGYFITGDTTYQNIVTTMQKFSSFRFAFIHLTNSKIRDELTLLNKEVAYNIFIDDKVSTSYKNLFKSSSRVLIKDSYNAEARNADYCDDEYFSDLFSSFSSEYYGYGDYQIVGSEYRETGGPAYAVALHFTYLKEQNGDEVWIRHFISDDRKTTANVQGKYFQALAKLVDFAENQYNNTPETIGTREFKNNLKSEEYHGLGYPKKLSIKHHIELMINLLSN